MAIDDDADDTPSIPVDMEALAGKVAWVQEQGAEQRARLDRLRAAFGPKNPWMPEDKLLRALGVTRRELERFDRHPFGNLLEYDGLGKYRINEELLDD